MVTVPRLLHLVSACLLFCANANGQVPQVYEDEAAFLAAVGTPSLIDFEGIAEPGSFVFLGNPGSYSDSGVTIENFTQMFIINEDGQYGTGSFLAAQGGEGQLVVITLPPDTVAVGFSYAFANSASGDVSLSSSTGLQLSAPEFGALGFFGAVLESGFANDRVVVAVSGGGIDLDNVLFIVDPDPSPSGTYIDEAAFLAELDAVTLIDFEGIAAPGEDEFVGNPGLFEQSGVTISNNSQMFVRNIIADPYGTGAFLAPQGIDPEIVEIRLPLSTVAVGFSYAYRIYGFSGATVAVDGQEIYLLPSDLTYAELEFFGMIRSDEPIESLTIEVDGGAIDIDNVWFTVDPSVRPVRYLDESEFLAAVQSPELIDFEGIVDPGESADYDDGGAYIEKGVRIANETVMFVQNNDYYGTQSYLSPQGGISQSVLIQLPQNTTAVGFSYSSSVATATINGSEVVAVPGQTVGALAFFGIVRDEAIQSIAIEVNDSYFDMDNFWFVSGPSAGKANTPGGGEVDTSFGSNGVLLLSDLFQSDDALFYGLGIQPGGGIIIAGTLLNDGQEPVVQVARLTLSGELDTTFGDNGTRSVYVGVGGGNAWDLDVLADGSILVAGRGDIASGDFKSHVFKLDANGAIDTTFGGSGVVMENLDPPGGPPPSDGFERVVVRNSGGILLGTAGLGTYQLDEHGVRDAGFGLSGRAQPENSAWSSYGLAEASDGKVVFGGGTAFLNSPQDFIVGRHLADGSALDTTFGNGGVAMAAAGAGNDELLDLVIDSQGRIVTVGYTEQPGTYPEKSAVARFLPTGQLDPEFGYGGIRVLDGLPLRRLNITHVINRPDGGLLLSGDMYAPAPLPNHEIFVMSLNENGTLDESFAGKGWQELDVIPDLDESDRYLSRDAMAIHPAGKIIALSWRCGCLAMLEAPPWEGGIRGDQDGDGKSDILFRNSVTGANQLYAMDGTSIAQNLPVSTVSPDWQPVGRGDYDGDGKSDILWRFTPTGALWIYFMDGNAVLSSQFVATVADANWRVVGNGDYNGDGKSDILWRHQVLGTVWLYEMDGNMITTSTGVGVVPNMDWKIEGSGDYNGDGNSDILWRNQATGTNWMYLMSGSTITTSIGVSVTPDLDWQIVGNGDYDGNGRSDILWRNASSGTNWLYLMNGTAIATSSSISVLPDLNWKIVGDGDYDGDGKADVLWRNLATGSNFMYLMDGLNITTNSQVSVVTDQNWQVINTR